MFGSEYSQNRFEEFHRKRLSLEQNPIYLIPESRSIPRRTRHPSDKKNLKKE